MVLTDNLVAYYKLDGNANDSHGTYNGTVSGAATTSTGKINTAYTFDGDDYISIGRPVTNNFSISLWVKITEFPSTTTPRQICTLGGDSATPSPTNYFYVTTTQDDIINAGNHASGIVTDTLSTGVWYHIVYMSSTSSSELYINGVSQGTGSGQSEYSSGYCAIGNLRSQDDCVNGIIDEVGIWSRALTASEVEELYNSGAGLSYPFTGGGISNTNFFTLTMGAEC